MSAPASRRPESSKGAVTKLEVRAIHPKAMPVILTLEEELESWMAASWPEAVRLQRPLPNGSLRIVARAVKKDEGM